MVIMKFLRILVILFFTDSIFSEKINLDRIIAIAGDGIIMESQFLGWMLSHLYGKSLTLRVLT